MTVLVSPAGEKRHTPGLLAAGGSCARHAPTIVLERLLSGPKYSLKDRPFPSSCSLATHPGGSFFLVTGRVGASGATSVPSSSEESSPPESPASGLTRRSGVKCSGIALDGIRFSHPPKMGQLAGPKATMARSQSRQTSATIEICARNCVSCA